MRDQDLVAVHDDDHIFEADGGHTRAVAVDHDIAAIHDLRGPPRQIAIRVTIVGKAWQLLPRRMDGIPIAYIRPTEIRRHHDGPVRILHDRIIDGFAFDPGKAARVGIKLTTFCCPTSNGAHYRCVKGRTIPLQLFQVGRGTKSEDAAVPAIFAALQEALRRFAVRFFDEARDAVAVFHRLALLEIAEAGLRRSGLDAERDEPPVTSQAGGGLRGLYEGRVVRNMVIARADEHHCIVRQPCSGKCDRRRRVLSLRLDDDLRGRIPAAELILHMGHMGVAGHDDRSGEGVLVAAAPKRRFEQGFLAHQRQERLGLGGAAAGPQTGAHAAAEDDRYYH